MTMLYLHIFPTHLQSLDPCFNPYLHLSSPFSFCLTNLTYHLSYIILIVYLILYLPCETTGYEKHGLFDNHWILSAQHHCA